MAIPLSTQGFYHVGRIARRLHITDQFDSKHDKSICLHAETYNGRHKAHVGRQLFNRNQRPIKCIRRNKIINMLIATVAVHCTLPMHPASYTQSRTDRDRRQETLHSLGNSICPPVAMNDHTLQSKDRSSDSSATFSNLIKRLIRDKFYVETSTAK